MQTESVALLLAVLLGAVAYLVYKVNRLERLLSEMVRPRRHERRRGKVIPLLKEDIEPGPFRREARERRPNPNDEE